VWCPLDTHSCGVHLMVTPRVWCALDRQSTINCVLSTWYSPTLPQTLSHTIQDRCTTMEGDGVTLERCCRQVCSNSVRTTPSPLSLLFYPSTSLAVSASFSSSHPHSLWAWRSTGCLRLSVTFASTYLRIHTNRREPS